MISHSFGILERSKELNDARCGQIASLIELNAEMLNRSVCLI